MILNWNISWSEIGANKNSPQKGNLNFFNVGTNLQSGDKTMPGELFRI
jgi:hypothetical protein